MDESTFEYFEDSSVLTNLGWDTLEHNEPDVNDSSGQDVKEPCDTDVDDTCNQGDKTSTDKEIKNSTSMEINDSSGQEIRKSRAIASNNGTRRPVNITMFDDVKIALDIMAARKRTWTWRLIDEALREYLHREGEI